MQLNDAQTSDLLDRAVDGSAAAMHELMQVHRTRLRQMVAMRLDRRLRIRLDPSDVVQDVLLEAAGRLAEYTEQAKLPFYVWMRQIAWDRLLELYRQHVRVEKRSVTREIGHAMPLTDDSVDALVATLRSRDLSPSEQLIRKEVQRRARQALAELGEVDRELLLMRYVEQMKLREIAAQLSISVTAAKSRHVRALTKISLILQEEEGTL
ncbi:MAG: sigma-70 family RNA polymerase sigma factor [Planctomycetales bacterium]|nr:sigma-70 family RNA polymerase sigma factor [Planctomycetales bacterium]MCA9166281.1 sigma-70 family RNA polymerase sigma factor [Planctomycetales bacterium]